ncbi:MAG: methylated-DNA--[protein]-cysteine S-methyltransferase [Phyllobacterium sp.]
MERQLQLVMEPVETPLGVLHLVAEENGALCAADWADCLPRMERLLGLHHRSTGFTLRNGKVPSSIKQKLIDYFAGTVNSIDDIPARSGGTGFQRAVWSQLRTVEAGCPVSYSTLAGYIGKPKAVRAVGHANGANPISIIVPCHRLIGANGALTGYAGGIARKRWLLDHEARNAAR